jgi:glyoxylase-like metal-dependent hydrolase (beta-lactamase superfamily II)
MTARHVAVAWALGAMAAVAVGEAVGGRFGLLVSLSAEEQDRLRTQPGLPSQPEPGTPQGTPTRPTDRPAIPAYDDGNVETLHVQGNVYLVAGGGANVVVQRGAEGLLLVNTGPARAAQAVLGGVRQVSDAPIRLILSTSADEELTGANEAISNAGRNINAGVGGPDGREPSRLEGAPIIATEAILHRMSGVKGEPQREPFGVWPHLTFYGPLNSRTFNGEVVEMRHVPEAHTDGDMFVWFRRSDVIAAGNLFSTTTYPVIDLDRGGSVQGLLNALNDMLDIAVPAFNNQGGTRIVPGHGRIGNESDLAEYRDMLTIIRDRVQAMVAKGMTLDQVRAARPTLDYDGIYASSRGTWTGEMFLEAVYRDLSGKKVGTR